MEDELAELKNNVSDLESRSDDDRLIGQLQRKLSATKVRRGVVDRYVGFLRRHCECIGPVEVFAHCRSEVDRGKFV